MMTDAELAAELAAIKKQRLDREAKANGKHPPPTTISMATLQTMTFEPIKYVVPGVIVEGLTLLAGKPKIGKSWLLLHAAIAVARGSFTLGEIHCPQGAVLYCALEDNLRRLQSRATKLLGITSPWPAQMSITCEMPRLTAGGLDHIRAWIDTTPNPRMIVIDTLAMIKSPKSKDQNIYDADYESVLTLRTLAAEKHLAITLVHHLRKADSDDAFDTVSGTLGLTGAPDSILIIRKDRQGTFTLHGRGRDLSEIEQTLLFNKDPCTWTILGDTSTIQYETTKITILAAMAEINPATPREIAAATNLRLNTAQQTMLRMAETGQLTKTAYGKYALP